MNERFGQLMKDVEMQLAAAPDHQMGWKYAQDKSNCRSCEDHI
jgi:hypothetical protein